MTDQIPLFLQTSDDTVRRVPSGDRLTPASLGLTGSPVGTSDTQTLTNKTLTSQKADFLHATSDNTKVLEVAATGGSPDVNWILVTNAPTTLSPVIEPAPSSFDAVVNLRLRSKGVGSNVTINNVPAVTTTATQTLTNKTLTTPVIGNFTSATHNHQNAAGGGQLTAAAFAAGQGLTRLLFAPIVSSAAIHTTAVETAFSNLAYPTTMNVLLGQLGQAIRVTFAGKLSTTGTPTVRFKIRGTAGIGTLWDSGAITCGSGVSNVLFGGSVILVARDVTASGVVFSTTAAPIIVGAVQTPLIGQSTAFDFVTLGGTSTNLELSVTWGTSSASNTATLETVALEALN